MKVSRFHTAFLILPLFLAACLSTQAPAPFARYSPGSGAGTTGIHTVLQGETLWLISKHYSIAARDIAVVNHLSPPFYLSPGSRIKLPPPQQYTARAGDSLNTVSRLFGVSRSEIAQMNDVSPPYTLHAGQVLRLPSVTQRSEPAVFAQKIESAPIVAPGEVMAETLAPPPLATPFKNPTVKDLTKQLPQEKPVQTAMLEPPPEKPSMEKPALEKTAPKSPVTAKVPKRAGGKFQRPVGGRLLSAYGPKSGGLFNDGINIAAPRDAPVRAAENGVVVYAGNELKGSGNLVLIRHEDRWMTAYAHLGNIQIKRGDVVKRGETIGTVGSTGSVDQPQLHFEVRRGTEALNPEVYLAG